MAIENVGLLHTEQRNPDTIGFASLSTAEMLKKINNEDKKVALAVEKSLPQIEKAVDLIFERVNKGGRMVYVGAGTSGRLGFMDASECRPTYGVDEGRVTCVMAGGREAVFSAKENVEDDPVRAAQDLKDFGLTDLDTVIAVAASGRTPYCIGALDYAKSIGAGAVSISCNPGAKLSTHADAPIEVDTGCETIQGSTRMKAGTAQKMIMNMLSTTVMVKMGRTYDNLMVCLHCKNEKIGNRMIRLFNEATGCEGKDDAEKYMKAAEGKLDAAILMYKSGKSYADVSEVMQRTESFYMALELLK